MRAGGTLPRAGTAAAAYHRDVIGDANVAWAEVARQVGLELYAWNEPFRPLASFRALKRALGGRIAGGPMSSAAMYGRLAPQGDGQGREALGATEWANDGWSSATFTHLHARVDPPLFLGLLVRAMPTAGPVAASHGLHHALAQQRGLRMRSWAPDRAHAILVGPGGSRPELLDAVVACHGDVMLTDSSVVCRLPGVLGDVALAAATYAQLAWIAGELSRRRVELGSLPSERAEEYAWATFASQAGMTFDEPRMEMTGALAGGQLKIALESEPGQFFTTVMVTFPSSLGLRLLMKRKSAHGGFASAFGGMDIPTGDPDFDRTFRLQADPPVGVQQLLWNKPALRRAFVDLGLYAHDGLVTDTQLAFRFRSCASELELAKIVDRVGIVMGSFFGGGAVGPYR
jgi:hypothetical protein